VNAGQINYYKEVKKVDHKKHTQAGGMNNARHSSWALIIKSARFTGRMRNMRKNAVYEWPRVFKILYKFLSAPFVLASFSSLLYQLISLLPLSAVPEMPAHRSHTAKLQAWG
jgi:hypothetical protein